MKTNQLARLMAVAKYLVPSMGAFVLLGLFLWAQDVDALFLKTRSGPADLRISYQGRLSDANDQPLAGSYEMAFALYTEQAGGAPFWSETYTTVPVQDGLFNVLLGSVVALPSPLPAGNLYLGVTVGGEEIAPRQLLSSSYHALESSLAAGVADGAVGTAQLAERAVTAAKLADESVASTQVADNSLTAADLAPASVTSSELASNAVDSSKILDGSVAAADLAPDSVGASQIASSAVGSSELASNAVNSSKIVDGSVVAVDLAADSVGASQISSGVVGSSELASNAVTSAKIQDGQVTSADIADNTIAEADIVDTFKARDANLLDGRDSTYFSVAGHAHDERYYTESESDGRFVNASGDTMSGNLDMGGRNINNANSVQIGNQGTVSARTDAGGGGPHMVLETDDVFTFQSGQGWFRVQPLLGTTLQSSSDIILKTGYLNHIAIDANVYTLRPTNTGTIDIGHPSHRFRAVYATENHIGATIETGFESPEEQTSGIAGVTEGDLLCWRKDGLARCNTPNDRLVQAVASATAHPIVLGAERVKVVGPVRRGDLLVASSTPGHAMVNNNPSPGIVIAQALEDFDGTTGLIKAMIRKF